jgi:excisionase family DNA binding protein
VLDNAARFDMHKSKEVPGGPPRLCSIELTTQELGISRTSVYELMAAGKLRSVKIGRRRFVPREAIDDFIAGLSA